MRNMVLLAYLIPVGARCLVPDRCAAQAPLRLAEALERAEQDAFANRIAAGESAASEGEALRPLKGILPSVRLESGYQRTTDPLGAFGFTLRQREVTPAAFAPASLNDPAAIGNLGTGLVLEQPLFNADAWLGRRAANRQRDAARAAERWTRTATAVDVVRGYWGTVLATEQVRALEQSLEAARSHHRQAESLAHQGMATSSDALLASVKAGEIEALLASARSQARLAKRGLALLMGAPGDTGFVMPDSLPSPDRLRSVMSRAMASPAGARADVEAADHALAAASADASRASALYLPRLNSFGRLDWNAPGAPFGGKSSWTVGVMLSWSPFSGASELSEHRVATGRQAAARAMAESATAQATLDLARAHDGLEVAAARLDIAEGTVGQAREAHRIVSRKYDGGLATVAELLDAATAETAAHLGVVAARYEAIMATTEILRAEGSELSLLGDLED